MRGETSVRRIRFILFILAAMLILAGCGGGDSPGGDIDPGQELVYIVDLCFVNAEYAITGDEELPALRYYPRQNMFAIQGEQYFTLLDVMLREGMSGIESLDTMIDDRVQFNSVEVSGNTAFVDIKGAGLSGSSLEEGLLISQIVNSLIGSFEEVERVQFLVDGETTDTLMGHYDASQPFETGIYPI